jgi:glycosyltransferase involved in cell wall biosynthesis
MNNRIAFVKFGGLSPGGTERWLQEMSVQLIKLGFLVDYYYCDSAPYLGSNFSHAGTDSSRAEYMKSHGVNLIEFKVGHKDLSTATHDWVNTDFWEIFEESDYLFVQSAIAGHAEYPFTKLKIPVIDFVALSGNVNNSLNLLWTIHLSHWQRKVWQRIKGSGKRTSVIPIPAFPPVHVEDLRTELGISKSKVVLGFHQRNDLNIFSELPLAAYHKLESQNTHFILLGGSDRHRNQAKQLGIRNVSFLDHNSSPVLISKFLNTLDIYAHGRSDGETFGTVIAEAMMHSLPIISHKVRRGANAQGETMGPAGYFVNNLNEYVRIMSRLIENPKLRQELGQAGHVHAMANYTPEINGLKLANLYNQLFPGFFPPVMPIQNFYEGTTMRSEFLNLTFSKLLKLKIKFANLASAKRDLYESQS